MVKIYGQLNTIFQQVGGENPDALLWVEMTSFRPEDGKEYLANQDGTWKEVIKSLEDVKTEKLEEIKVAFTTIEDSGYTVSSLGYKVDATKKSLEDVQGLIKLAEAGMTEMPVQFRDYDNAFHACTLGDLKTLEMEIIAHGVKVYSEKWTLEATVEAAITVEQVEAVDPHTMSGYDWEKAQEPVLIPADELVIETL